ATRCSRTRTTSGAPWASSRCAATRCVRGSPPPPRPRLVTMSDTGRDQPGSDDGGPQAGPGDRRGRGRPRGAQLPRQTPDRGPRDSRGSAGWVRPDPGRVMRVQSECVEGFGALAEVGPAVSVSGSARTKPDHPDYALAEDVGRRLVDEGFAVITGGGPGIMEAANKGASEAGGLSVGLGIELPFEQGMNRYVNL